MSEIVPSDAHSHQWNLAAGQLISYIQMTEGLSLSAVLKTTVRTPLTGPPSTSSRISPSLWQAVAGLLKGHKV